MKNSADTQVTNSETIENNKLIAEFRGNRFEPLPNTNNECFSLLGSWDVIHITDFEIGIYAYHSDWNRLMPVVEKIFNSDYDESQNLIGDITHALVDINIQEVYTAVVEFIKWYNTTAKVLGIINKM